MFPRFVPVGDHALLVEFADAISEAATARVLDLDRALTAHPPDGLVEVVPGLVNLLVEFDPVTTTHEDIQAAVVPLLEQTASSTKAAPLRQVPVCYDADFAPDLSDVAARAGISEEAVIKAHLAGDYRVLMYGFAPGYAYMGGVPEAIQCPRKPSPVRDVPAGSLLIAGPQCLISTLTMPTGWSIIGRVATRVLTGDPARPFLFDVGDRVQFTRVSRAEFEAGQGGVR
ncbi:5-oxoprolinase subunit B family protein [Aliiroseovarius marinus]|uniref:5-oxoprolinase subunit B family protein n=1 Tax=Aliiroseovarius marinus TaxID=2500159 RepID=UPI003D7DFC5D